MRWARGGVGGRFFFCCTVQCLSRHWRPPAGPGFGPACFWPCSARQESGYRKGGQDAQSGRHPGPRAGAAEWGVTGRSRGATRPRARGSNSHEGRDESAPRRWRPVWQQAAAHATHRVESRFVASHDRIEVGRRAAPSTAPGAGRLREQSAAVRRAPARWPQRGTPAPHRTRPLHRPSPSSHSPGQPLPALRPRPPHRSGPWPRRPPPGRPRLAQAAAETGWRAGPRRCGRWRRAAWPPPRP